LFTSKHLGKTAEIFSTFTTFAPRNIPQRPMSKELIAIFLGGGIGSVLRYCVQMALHERIIPYSFPWATFTVNILGSFLIGLFYSLSARFNLSTEVRMLLTTGLCGGFTTFSTFSNDGLIMIKQGFYGMFILYTLLSIILGITAAFAGGACGRYI
jgi:CrcB protein